MESNKKYITFTDMYSSITDMRADCLVVLICTITDMYS